MYEHTSSPQGGFPLVFDTPYSTVQDWMWSWLDVFIVLTSIWDVVVEIVEKIMEGQGVQPKQPSRTVE